MITKEIDKEKYGHNRAVLTEMLEDESIKVELYTMDEEGMRLDSAIRLSVSRSLIRLSYQKKNWSN